VLKGQANSFSAAWAPKKRLGRIRLSDVLSRLIALTTQNDPLDVLKKEFGKFDELMFQGVQRCLNVLKCDFGDVHEAMLLDVERSFQRIFYILGIQRRDLDEVIL
jgi:hypothetical protein